MVIFFVIANHTPVGANTFTKHVTSRPILKLPAVYFAHFEDDLPDMTNLVSDLSVDQSYLYEMFEEDIKGLCSAALFNRDHGLISY
jgi:hypothetical protein